jgi:hypothetical protein
MDQSQTGTPGGGPEGGGGMPLAAKTREERESAEYSFTRVMVVFLFSHVVGLLGGAAFALILLAPLALPWWAVIVLLGDRIGPLAILFAGGGFASGCFLHIQLPKFPARFLLLFIGNPAFVFFLMVVLNPDAIASVKIPGFYLNQDLMAAAGLTVCGTFFAILGDRYAWRHKEQAGIG